MEYNLTAVSYTEEEMLVQKILNGETALFEILIRRTNPALYKVARCYGYNHQDAEDLMQETYLTAYTQLKNFQSRSQFKTWITKILIHKCLYKLTYGAYKREHPASDSINENAMPMLPVNKKMETESAVIRHEFSKIIEHALQQLPLHYRTVFILREIEGYNVAETAELLAITPINVKVRLARAKAMLQQQLEQYYSKADIFEFNLVYCNKIVANVMAQITAKE